MTTQVIQCTDKFWSVSLLSLLLIIVFEIKAKTAFDPVLSLAKAAMFVNGTKLRIQFINYLP